MLGLIFDFLFDLLLFFAIPFKKKMDDPAGIVRNR